MIPAFIGPSLQAAGNLVGLSGQVADLIWGKDIEKKDYAGVDYLGGNPSMAGRYQGEFANLKGLVNTYEEHKSPWYSEYLAPYLSAGLSTAGNMLSAFGGQGDGGYKNDVVPRRTWGKGEGFSKPKNAPGIIRGANSGFDIIPDQYIPGYDPRFQEDQLYGKSGIHIKPSRRGTFTKWCKEHGYGGVTSDCISAAKNKEGAVKKKAVFAQNARKWKKGEDGMLIEDVQGRSHEEGGEQRILNGMPVEVEDQEWIIRLDDGSIAVLNENQQRMLAKGKSLGQVVNKLPKVSPNAQLGTEIPPNMMEEYLNEAYIPDIPFEYDPMTNSINWMQQLPEAEITAKGEFPLRPPMIRGGIGEYDIKGKDMVQVDKKKPKIEQSSFYGNTGGIMKNVIDNTGQTKVLDNDIVKLIEEYKRRQKLSAIGNASLAAAEAGVNLLDYLHNLKEKPPKDIEGISPVFGQFTPINPEPAIRAIKQGERAAMKQAIETGKSELITPIAASSDDAINKLLSEVEGINANTRNQILQSNLNASIEASRTRMQADSENVRNLFAWETALATANANALGNMFAALNKGNQMFAQIGNNLLSADIIKHKLKGSGSDDWLLQLHDMFT